MTRLLPFFAAIWFPAVRRRSFPEVPDRNVWVVYQTIFVLSVAYGMAIALTPMVLEQVLHFDSDRTAQTAAWFGLGIVSFALPSGAILRRLTARNTLAICIVGYAAMIGIFPFLREYWHIALCRYLDGAFSVGAWVSCETLLLWRSERDSKAAVTSLYAIATAFGYVVGPVIFRVLSELGWGPESTFVLAASIAAASSVLARLRLDPDPDVQHEHDASGASTDALAPMRSHPTLAWHIKTSAAATFASGFFQASSVIFLPLYLVHEKGIDHNDTFVVVALSAGAMLVISNRMGRLGDRHGHLLVMRVLASLGVVGIALFGFLDDYVSLCIAIFVAGGCLASIPPLSLALQGVIATPAEYARSNSIFNVFFATGLLTGPLATNWAILQVGYEGVLYAFGVLWSSFVLFSLVFLRDDPRTRRVPVESVPAA